MLPKKSGEEKQKNYESGIRSKEKIIAEHENGVRVSDPVSKYRMPKSTTSTFFKNDMIKAVNVAKGPKVICRQGQQKIEEVEKLCLVY